MINIQKNKIPLQKIQSQIQDKMSKQVSTRKVIDPHFIYLNWRRNNNNPKVQFLDDRKDTVHINSTIGPYKNVYSEQVFEKNNVYVWQIKIDSGTYIKIGVLKESQINGNNKFKAFSDSKNGYAYYSLGKIRNGSNKEGIQFGKGFGPGDVVTVKFDTKFGTLQFAVNDGKFQQAFLQPEFTAGGYVAAVAGLHQGCKFSLTIPNLED